MTRTFKFRMRNCCDIQANPARGNREGSADSGRRQARDHGSRTRTFRTIIQTAIFTGAQVSELLALRWQDGEFENGTVEIRRSMSTAKVKGEAMQEEVRWFDPKTKQGKRKFQSRRN